MTEHILGKNIAFDDLFGILYEMVEAEPGSVPLKTQEAIMPAISRIICFENDHDKSLLDSGVIYLFFNTINERFNLDIPDELIDSTLTFENLLGEVNRMIDANNLLRIRFDAVSLAVYLKKLNSMTVDPGVLKGTVSTFLHKVQDHFYGETPPLYEVLAETLMYLGLRLSSEEMVHISGFTSMSEVYRFIDQKLASRSPNDCHIRYDNVWSPELQQITKETLTHFPAYPAGIRMKHIAGKFGAIALPSGTVNGVSEKPLPGHYFIKVDNLITHFDSLTTLIESGWAVD